MSAASNIKWAASSQVARLLIQLGGMAALSRLIAADEFGLMALVMVVGNFSNLVRDLGTAAAVIQSPNLNQKKISSIFWFNIALGVAIFVSLFIFRNAIACFFSQPSLALLLAIIAITFPINSSAAVHQALMERDSKFRKLAAIEIGSSLAALLVAIVLGYIGAGAIALASQSLCYAIFSSALLWWTSKWRPNFNFDLAELSQVSRFSANLSAFNIINYFSRNADSIAIGKFMSVAELGNYSVAYRLMLFPLQSLSFTVSRALYPIMSAAQSSKAEIGSLYLKSLFGISFVTAPLMAAMWVTRDVLVPTLIGNQWLYVPKLLTWLAPVGYIQSIVATTGTTLMARGRTDVLLKLGLLGTTLHVFSFIIGAQYSLYEFVICYFISNILNALPSLYVSLHFLDKTLIHLWRTLMPSIGCALVSVVAIKMIGGVLNDGIDSSIMRLSLLLALYLFVYISLCYSVAKLFPSFIPEGWAERRMGSGR